GEVTEADAPDREEATDAATELHGLRRRLRLVDARPPTPTPPPLAVRALPPPPPVPLYADAELRPTTAFRPPTSCRQAARGVKRPFRAPAGPVAAAALIAILTVASGSGGRAPLPPPAPSRAQVMPRATPLVLPRAPTGTLAVAGPPGAEVTIGAAAYPPAPC